MGRKFFLNVLEKLAKMFADRPQVLELVTDLIKIVEEAKDELFVPNLTPAKQEFKLPVEILEDQNSVALFTDGACRGNPGPGSWAAMAQDHQGNVLFESTSVEMMTTNNRMELEGVIQGLQILKTEHANETIHVYSDSKYVIDGLSQWVHGWKKRGWLKADNRPPENVELWKSLDALQSEFKTVKLHWVRGHAGHPQNEHCDLLANKILNEAGY